MRFWVLLIGLSAATSLANARHLNQEGEQCPNTQWDYSQCYAASKQDRRPRRTASLSKPSLVLACLTLLTPRPPCSLLCAAETTPPPKVAAASGASRRLFIRKRKASCHPAR